MVSTVVKSEHVIVAIIARGTALLQVETLAELDLVAAVDLKTARHERHNSIVCGGLGVESLHRVCNGGHLRKFAKNVVDAEELFSLVGHHRLFSVQLIQGCSVRVEGLVVVGHKLFGHVFELAHNLFFQS